MRGSWGKAREPSPIWARAGSSLGSALANPIQSVKVVWSKIKLLNENVLKIIYDCVQSAYLFSLHMRSNSSKSFGCLRTTWRLRFEKLEVDVT